MVPEFVERTRGSEWVRALPAGSKWNRGGNADRRFSEKSGNPQTLAASIYGGQWSSIETAAATGCGHCPPCYSIGRMEKSTGSGSGRGMA